MRSEHVNIFSFKVGIGAPYMMCPWLQPPPKLSSKLFLKLLAPKIRLYSLLFFIFIFLYKIMTIFFFRNPWSCLYFVDTIFGTISLVSSHVLHWTVILMPLVLAFLHGGNNINFFSIGYYHPWSSIIVRVVGNNTSYTR